MFHVVKVHGTRHTKNLKVCTLAKDKIEEHKGLLEIHNGIEKPPMRLSELFTAYLNELRVEGKEYVRLASLFRTYAMNRNYLFFIPWKRGRSYGRLRNLHQSC